MVLDGKATEIHAKMHKKDTKLHWDVCEILIKFHVKLFPRIIHVKSGFWLSNQHTHTL